MRDPMTTKQAYAKYLCDECRAGGDCNQHNCVEGCTCSLPCTYCSERIWFLGSLGDAENPEWFECPYCKEQTINRFKKL